MLGHAWRVLGREFRSGELRLLFAALAIAVAAVTAVGFFADRVRLALEREAQQMMGGDLILIADHALPESYAADARQRGLKLAKRIGGVFHSWREDRADRRDVANGLDHIVQAMARDALPANLAFGH
jgi:predicted lysophospholipase L1 biosynthesis ABC-type transport system permease subunit